MLSKLRHNLNLALPMLSITALVGISSKIGLELIKLTQVQRPDSPFYARLADGIDQLAQAAVLSRLQEALQVRPNLLGVVAAASTGISVLAVLVYALKMLKGSGDVVGFISHLADRVKLSSYENWGVVRDIKTDEPLPYARIRLVNSHGKIVASSVADCRGNYGFHMPKLNAFNGTHRLEVSKSSYYFPPSIRKNQNSFSHYYGGFLPVATAVPNEVSVYLEAVKPQISHAKPGLGGKLWHGLVSASFWVSVIVAPLAAITAPNSVKALLIGSLAVAMLARIGGIHHSF